LRTAVADGRLRGDLFARLDGLTVELPPLRQRIEEIPFLFTRILETRANTAAPPQIDVGVAERLCLYDWPFNVRELDLIVRQVLALHSSEAVLRRAHLPERLQGSMPSNAPVTKPAEHQSPEPDMDLIVTMLRANQGNVARTAAALKISRQRLYRLMEGSKELELERRRKPDA
jgi:transcriptional regulator with PAS, ATPase and Fis domain